MNVNRRFLNWGVFLVTAGAVMLVAGNSDAGRDAIVQVLRAWPALVIAFGVALILRQTRFGVAGGMLAAAVPGLLLGGVVSAAPDLGANCRVAPTAPIEVRDGVFGQRASVELELSCGDLSVTTTPGAGWRLETGTSHGPVPTVDSGADRLSVRSVSTKSVFGPFRGADRWRLALPTDTALDLGAEINAGHGRFDLAGARLGSLDVRINAAEADLDLAGATVDEVSVRANAAKATVRLGAEDDLAATVDVNAAALTVCSPPQLGVRIIEDGTVLGSTHLNGFVKNGAAWETPGYALADHHADVTLSVNVGSVDVNPEGGCK